MPCRVTVLADGDRRDRGNRGNRDEQDLANDVYVITRCKRRRSLNFCLGMNHDLTPLKSKTGTFTSAVAILIVDPDQTMIRPLLDSNIVINSTEFKKISLYEIKNNDIISIGNLELLFNVGNDDQVFSQSFLNNSIFNACTQQPAAPKSCRPPCKPSIINPASEDADELLIFNENSENPSNFESQNLLMEYSEESANIVKIPISPPSPLIEDDDSTDIEEEELTAAINKKKLKPTKKLEVVLERVNDSREILQQKAKNNISKKGGSNVMKNLTIANNDIDKKSNKSKAPISNVRKIGSVDKALLACNKSKDIFDISNEHLEIQNVFSNKENDFIDSSLVDDDIYDALTQVYDEGKKSHFRTDIEMQNQSSSSDISEFMFKIPSCVTPKKRPESSTSSKNKTTPHYKCTEEVFIDLCTQEPPKDDKVINEDEIYDLPTQILPLPMTSTGVSKELDKKTVPYYKFTQEIENDLLTQVEEVSRTTRTSKELKTYSSRKSHSKPAPYYNFTQDIVNDLLTQDEDVSRNPKVIHDEIKSLFGPNECPTPFNAGTSNYFNSTQEILDVLSSDDKSGIKTPDKCIVNKFTSRSPDSQEVHKYTNKIVKPFVPESDSSTDCSDEESPLIKHKRKLPPVQQMVFKKKAFLADDIDAKKRKTEVKNEIKEEDTKTKKVVKEVSNTKKVDQNISLDVSTSSRSSRINTKKYFEIKEEDTKTRKVVKEVSNTKKVDQNISLDVSTSSRSSRISTKKFFSDRCKVVFTTLLNQDTFEDIVNKLGGTVVSADGNVLVTSQLKNTKKLLEAVSKRIPIVSVDWLKDSEKAKCFADPFKYILRDRQKEKKYGCDLNSLYKIRIKFLSGWTVYVTPSITMPFEDIKSLIEMNGGKCVLIKELKSYIPMKNVDSFTISCLKDEDLYKNLPKPHCNYNALTYGIMTGTLNFKNSEIKIYD